MRHQPGMHGENVPGRGWHHRSMPKPPLDADLTLRALAETYRAVTATVAGLAAEAFERPSRCEGWKVKDVLYHLLLDPQRALMALASPATEEPTTDHVEYWREFQPGTADAARHAEFVRRSAAAYANPTRLAEHWEEASEAALRATAAAAMAVDIRDRAVRSAAARHGRPSGSAPRGYRTQGLVIALPDLLATLAVEAALHHLDLSLELTAPPATPATALSLTRQTLEGVLGAALPPAWDDVTAALKGTGRAALSDEDRGLLGDLAGRFPLFG
jgi:hypothetical protein